MFGCNRVKDENINDSAEVKNCCGCHPASDLNFIFRKIVSDNRNSNLIKTVCESGTLTKFFFCPRWFVCGTSPIKAKVMQNKKNNTYGVIKTFMRKIWNRCTKSNLERKTSKKEFNLLAWHVHKLFNAVILFFFL